MAYYSFADLEWMVGWVGLVGFPHSGRLSYEVVRCQP